MEALLLENSLALGESSVFTPECTLPSQWFIDRQVFSERFIDATGIVSRHISSLDELEMAKKAVESLRNVSHFDASKCAAIVVASSSLSSRDKGLYELRTDEIQGALFEQWPRVSALAEALRHEINPRLKDDCAIGINWGCNGFVRGVEILRDMHALEPLRDGQFYLLITANRLSSRVNFGSPTSGLFGDSATATMITGFKDTAYDPKFLVHYAHAEPRGTEGVGFFMQENRAAVSFTADGEVEVSSRACIEMQKEVMGRYGIQFTQEVLEAALAELALPKVTVNGILIGPTTDPVTDPLTEGTQQADAKAPNTMISSQRKSILLGHATSLVAGKIEHNLRRSNNDTQILRSTAELGNTSSSAIVNELVRFPDLTGLIACPVAGAGSPGEPHLGQGCLILEGIQGT